MALRWSRTGLLVVLICLLVFATPTAAFGAGNIASISRIEGHNWRHGDIEDLLKTVPFLRHHKWTSLMIKRVYFGNWLRDYSQAIDVGTLRGVQADTIRILVWVLSFLSFGYATGEFEVTEERLGVYKPEEHIDNPKDYADNADARQYDPRLRPPVQPAELAVDPQTGMKNYIANESGFWATSSGYVKHSFARSIHYGRVYTSGAHGTSGKEADLCEALRCLGQGLHCVEDFAAHSNYVELALRELGYRDVFPHTGSATELNLRGRRVFPLVTGTFGAVDFLHSVLGEATDHFTQSEVNQMDVALVDAQKTSKRSSVSGQGGSGSAGNGVVNLLSQLPGTGPSLSSEAKRLRDISDAQERAMGGQGSAYDTDYQGRDRAAAQTMPSFAGPPGSAGGPPAPGIPGMSPNFDPVRTAKQIYPILEFRDRVVRAISTTIEMVPGLQALCERISETITVFVLSLLAPFIRPIINAVSKQLKEGSSAVVDSSGRHQFEPWTDPYCTDPTHSLLSKDHFANMLNEVAGQVAAVTLQYVAPRVIYAWSHPDVPLQQVMDDITRVFHHPALQDRNCQLHRDMFEKVRKWAESQPGRGSSLNKLLGSESVRRGGNIREGGPHHHGYQGVSHSSGGGHSKVRDSEWERVAKRLGVGIGGSGSGGGSGGGGHRDVESFSEYPQYPPASTSYQHDAAPPQQYGQSAQDPYASGSMSPSTGPYNHPASPMMYQQPQQGYPGSDYNPSVQSSASPEIRYYEPGPPSQSSPYAGGEYSGGGEEYGGGYAGAPPSQYYYSPHDPLQQQQYGGYDQGPPQYSPPGGDPGYRY